MSLSNQEKVERIRTMGLHFHRVMAHAVSEAGTKYEDQSTELVLEAELAAIGIYAVQTITALTVLTNKEKTVELDLFIRAITETYLMDFDNLSKAMTNGLIVENREV